MTAAEISAQLTLVKNAITALLTGKAQSVSIAGRSVTMLELNELNKMRRDLETELAAVNAGANRPAVVRFVNP